MQIVITIGKETNFQSLDKAFDLFEVSQHCRNDGQRAGFGRDSF